MSETSVKTTKAGKFIRFASMLAAGAIFILNVQPARACFCSNLDPDLPTGKVVFVNGCQGAGAACTNSQCVYFITIPPAPRSDSNNNATATASSVGAGFSKVPTGDQTEVGDISLHIGSEMEIKTFSCVATGAEQVTHTCGCSSSLSQVLSNPGATCNGQPIGDYFKPDGTPAKPQFANPVLKCQASEDAQCSTKKCVLAYETFNGPNSHTSECDVTDGQNNIPCQKQAAAEAR